MSNNEEKALELFANGHNCSQSVLAAFSNELKISGQQAVSVAAGFGAGICFQGQMCGAVSAAYMALGLHSGKLFNNSVSVKENTYKLIRNFNQQFEQKNKYTNCTSLLGIDISTTEGLNRAIENGVFESKCPKLVKSAVSICKQLIQEND